jgi:hypothetical protein
MAQNTDQPGSSSDLSRSGLVPGGPSKRCALGWLLANDQDSAGAAAQRRELGGLGGKHCWAEYVLF